MQIDLMYIITTYNYYMIEFKEKLILHCITRLQLRLLILHQKHVSSIQYTIVLQLYRITFLF